MGVGVDLCSVSRLQAALERTPGLWNRLFTAVEQRALQEQRVGRGSVAVAAIAAQMFAVKEAVMKSLGVGFDTVPFDSIEVDAVAPSILLHGVASERAERLGAGSLDVQLGFVDGPDGRVAVAEVVAIGR